MRTKDGDVIKPDVCLVSLERVKSNLVKRGPHKRLVLQGGPDLVVELRSPSNTRPEEKRKRPQYFDNGTLIVWDVGPAFGLTGYLLSLIQSVS